MRNTHSKVKNSGAIVCQQQKRVLLYTVSKLQMVEISGLFCWLGQGMKFTNHFKISECPLKAASSGASAMEAPLLVYSF